MRTREREGRGRSRLEDASLGGFDTQMQNSLEYTVEAKIFRTLMVKEWNYSWSLFTHIGNKKKFPPSIVV